MNSKEDELSELQEQIEKYQSLLEITSAAGDKKKVKPEADTANLKKLYALAFGTSSIHSTACQAALCCLLTKCVIGASYCRS